MPYKYKVKQDSEGQPLLPDGSTLPGVGVVKNGQLESSTPIENPNLELIDGEQKSAHLDGVVPQAAQSAQSTPESEGTL